jgi:esterase
MELNYYSCGEGAPLIILHGLFGGSDNWQTLSKQFKEHFQIFAVDLRNHGNSPHSDAFDYPAMAEDLREFLEKHALTDALILGHSMGGKVAMQFATSNPERVRKLVVADIAPKDYPPHHEPILKAMLKLDLRKFAERAGIDAALAPDIPSAGLRQFLMKSVARSEEGGFKWKIHLRAIHDNYAKIAAAPALGHPFLKPTLFLRGEKSDYILPEDESTIRRFFPAAELKTIAGAGHWLHAEKPQEFFEITRDFLKQ